MKHKSILLLAFIAMTSTVQSVLVWISGAPGTGKTCAVRELKEINPDWIYLSMDEYLELHDAAPVEKDGTLKPQNWLNFAYPLHIMQAIVELALNNPDFSSNIIVIESVMPACYMVVIKEILYQLGITIDFHIHLYCKDKILLSRLLERKALGRALWKIPTEKLYEHRTAHRFRKSPHIKMIDNSNITPKETANAISKYIEEECYWL